jgi:hypothetical protein
MIDYVCRYTKGSLPTLDKRFVAESGEEFSVSIAFEAENERKNIPSEVIYEHLDNLVKYIQDESESISITQGDDNNLQPWPIIGWEKIEIAKFIIINWWQYVYFLDEEEEELEEGEDHTHV